MVTRTATLRLQLIDAVSGPSRGVAGALRGMDGSLKNIGKNASPELQRLVKDLERLKKAAATSHAFQQTARDAKDMRRAFQEARNDVAKLEQALKTSTKPTAKMKSDLKSAKQVLSETARAWREQIRAKNEAETAFNRLKLGGFRAGQKRIQEDIKRTTEAIRHQLEVEKKLGEQRNKRTRTTRDDSVRDATITALGTTGVYYGARGARSAFENAVEMDKETRFQAAIAGLNAEQQKPLTEQAMRIGKETRFTNPDVVRAQTSVLQAGVRNIDVVMGMMESITDYALAMNVTLEEATETVRGGMQSKNKDLTNPATAEANTRDFVNYLVNMAKRGGMNDDDVRQFLKYSGSPTTTVGLPDDLTAAMGIILRRGGLRGDEAGVFGRALSGKLVAPTNKGRDALAAMGIDYDKFTKMGGLNLTGLETVIKQKFGKALTDEMRDALKEAFEEGTFIDSTGEEMPISSDRGMFTTAISDILSPLFAGQNGKVAAADAKALSKAIGDYHKNSVESVDVVGLLDAIMKKNPTFAQLEALFTNRQSGRGAVLASRWGDVETERENMRKTPNDLANRIGRQANEGMYGDWTRLQGSIETLFTTIGKDWEDVIRPALKATSDLIDGFSELPQPLRRVAEAAVAAAVGLAGLAVLTSGKNLLARLLGGAAAGAAATTATTSAAAAATETASSAALLRFLAGSRGSILGLGYMGGVAGLATLFNGRGGGYGKPTLTDQRDDAINRENFRRLWGPAVTDPGAWEGGRHRAWSGFGPRPGESTIFGSYADAAKRTPAVKPEPSVDVKPVQKPASKFNPELMIDMERQRKYDAQFPGGFEGGRHRAYSGSGPEPVSIKGSLDAGQITGEAQQAGDEIERELSVEATPTLNVGALMQAAENARAHLKAMLSVQATVRAGASTPEAKHPLGHRRAGGPVVAGRSYIVGERGEEVLTMGSNGYVTPNHRLERQRSGMTNHFHIKGHDPKAVAQEISKVLDRQLTRSRASSINGRPVTP